MPKLSSLRRLAWPGLAQISILTSPPSPHIWRAPAAHLRLLLSLQAKCKIYCRKLQHCGCCVYAREREGEEWTRSVCRHRRRCRMKWGVQNVLSLLSVLKQITAANEIHAATTTTTTAGGRVRRSIRSCRQEAERYMQMPMATWGCAWQACGERR